MTRSKKLWTAAEYISGGPFQLPPAFLGGERTKDKFTTFSCKIESSSPGTGLYYTSEPVQGVRL